MNMRIIGAVFAGFLLAGCTDADWDHAMSYAGLGQSDQTASPQAAPADESVAAPTPAAQASKSDDWCREIAKAAAADAAGNGFDAPTQQHRAEVTYRQCSESSLAR
ncbi:MAG: hypothetical protein KGM97_00385 [Alphaproteobacteria bacterium]|nr:hypothetical protein [Alphaproteobacteria bacterium]MDE2629421.1 hypothetical protein [Alphaproteobacteria bacterium]